MHTDPMVVSLRASKASVDEGVPKKPTPRKKYGRIILTGIALLLVTVAAVSIYMNRSSIARLIEPAQTPRVSEDAKSPDQEKGEDHTPATELQAKATAEAEANAEIEDIVLKVGKLIRLPQDEVPTVATVTKPEELKDQVFFADAKVGDKVLIYTKAQLALLYDPRANILVKVAPITTEAAP